MSYYLAKKVMLAKQYLAEREAADRLNPPDERLQRSRVWLERYMAQGCSATKFNWAPRWPMTPPKDDTHGQEIIEGEFTVVADTDAQGEQGGLAGGSQAATHASRGATPG